MNKLLQKKLKELPRSPGCYLMKDAGGKIIYVGKAVNLRNRVSSYFRGVHDGKTEKLVEKIADFETVLVNSESEALILEANLIRQYDPHYNILLRDDKHYPYLRLTLNEDYPRLMVARRAKADGSRYFGPYPSVGSIHKAKEVVEEIFPLRTCSHWKDGQRACLNAHIGKCSAPCEGRISKEEYGKIVEQISLFLQGKMPALIREKEKLMLAASEKLEFEEAARQRDAIRILKGLAEQQKIDSGNGFSDFDLIAIAAHEELAVAQLFFVRQGAVVSRANYTLDISGTVEKEDLLYRFLQEYYSGGDRIPAELYLPLLPRNAARLEESFSASSHHKVRLLVPQKGKKQQLLRLVQENANALLANKINTWDQQEKRNSEALESLRLALGLEITPRRMECYDISHIQGTDMVGSMVVFLNGAPATKCYRRFRIKTLDGSNDFAALQEVLERRWLRGIEERKQGKEPLDFGDLPDLIVIDGGKGQLSSVLEQLNELPGKKPPIISLAKQFEEIYIPYESEPIRLAYEDPALQLMQRLRDEAHRFAITYHRNLRSKRQIHSQLEDVPGIGPKRRQALLKAFDDMNKLRAASVQMLAVVPGMTYPAAEELYRQLHAGKEENRAK